MKITRPAFLWAGLLLSICQALSAAEHPRLLFGANEVDYLRERVTREPYASILEAIRIGAERSHDAYNNRTDTADYGALYFYTQDEQYAEAAAKRSMEMIADSWMNGMWYNPSHMSLQRSFWGIQVAYAYDYCYDSDFYQQTIPATFESKYSGTVEVPTQFVGRTWRDAISEAIRDAADLLVESGGQAFPGTSRTTNNWHAVRYGGAIIMYYATDHPYEDADMKGANFSLNAYLGSNLTDDEDAKGWNPEGHGYNHFPAQFWQIAVFLREKFDGVDLSVPAQRFTHWSTIFDTLPLPWTTEGLTFRGIHPDFSDDNPIYFPEGGAALALATAFHEDPRDPNNSFDYRPGLLWMLHRYWGDTVWGDSGKQGDGLWHSSRGAGHLLLYYYPDPLAEEPILEENPEDVWGLNYYDPSYGSVAFRNRFGDADGDHIDEDTVIQMNANLRENKGGHWGPDALSPRLIGLGVPWIVGNGRSNARAGHTNIFPVDPNSSGDGKVGSGYQIKEINMRPGGGGWVTMSGAQTDMAVNNQQRSLVVDYTGATGAEGFFIMADRSDNGQWWRLNTLYNNTITTDGNTFTITSPEGHRLIGHVIYPENVSLRVGTQRRGNAYQFGSQSYSDNRVVDFAHPGTDGEFLVALAMVRAGADAPALSSEYVDADNWQIAATGRQFKRTEGEIVATGWERPEISITAPFSGQRYNVGQESVWVAGKATDSAGGQVDFVEVYLNDVYQGNAAYDPATQQWLYQLHDLPIGGHLVRARAVDNDRDDREAEVTFSIAYRHPDSTAYEITVDNTEHAEQVTTNVPPRDDGRSIGGDYLWSWGGGEAFAVFTPVIPITGYYEVYSYYRAALPMASEQAYVINHASGQEVTYLDHQKNGFQWNLVGTWEFREGTANNVTLDGSLSNGSFSADALRWVFVPSDNEPPVAAIDAPVLTAEAPATLSFSGSASTDDGSIASYTWHSTHAPESTQTGGLPSTGSLLSPAAMWSAFR